jgi:hypothetical protein
MGQIPWWKLTREAKRFGSQLRSLPADLSSYLFAARYYDAVLGRKKVVQIGELPLSSRVAIYLIFPDRGVLASHRRALTYLAGKGLSPIVVSNLPLNHDARRDLLGRSSRLIERPNFGYDFGGYRDGILSLVDRLASLEQLVLVNDSVWFPLPGAADWIDQVAALEVDFAAAASNFGIPRRDANRFRDIQWTYRTDHRNFHYCSFALSFSRKVIQDPDFLRFWLWFPLSNKKKRTVRRGEIGLTQWVLARDFSHGETLGIARLPTELAELNDARLSEVARNTIILDDARMQTVKRTVLTGSTPLDRAAAEKMILAAVARKGASYALADFSIHEKRFPFLKKSPVWLDENASNITMALIAGLGGENGTEIQKEAADLRAARAPSFSGPKDRK